MGKKHTHKVGGDKMVQQHFHQQTDLNAIMAKSKSTGGAPTGVGIPSGRKPQFLNMTGESFHEMLCKVQEAQGQFAGFPAKIRRRFANNPENMLRFLQDDANMAEAAHLGLIDLDSLPAERKAQLDLVEEAEKADAAEMLEFRKWQAARRRAAQDDKIVSGALRADDEANPRKSAK